MRRDAVLRSLLDALPAPSIPATLRARKDTVLARVEDARLEAESLSLELRRIEVLLCGEG